MKKLLALAAVASLAAFAAPAFAATDSANGSIGYSDYNISSFNVGALNGRIGWNSGPLGVEGEGAFGLQGDSTGAGINKETVKLSSEFGAFATAQADVSKEFEIYGRAGYATAQFKSTDGTGSTATHDNDSGSGFAYGAGAVYMFDGMDGVRGDYTVYDLGIGSGAHHSGNNADVWSVSLVRKFK